jgi:hypothetical protein
MCTQCLEDDKAKRERGEDSGIELSDDMDSSDETDSSGEVDAEGATRMEDSV